MRAIYFKKKAVSIIRLFVFLILCTEIATLKGYTPFGTDGLTGYWVGYTLMFYLVFYELPVFCLRQSDHLYLFIPVGWLIVLDIYFDGIGCLLNLFNRYQHYDTFMHTTFFPWALTAISVSLSMIYCKKYGLVSVPKLPLVLGFMGAMTLMSMHEIIELGIDQITASNAGTGATDISDTASDLLCNLIGSGSFIVVFWFFWKKAWLKILSSD